jgi:hypothetical protein
MDGEYTGLSFILKQGIPEVGIYGAFSCNRGCMKRMNGDGASSNSRGCLRIRKRTERPPGTFRRCERKLSLSNT